MSYQCLVVKNIAKNIKNAQLGLKCNDYCDYYDLILFDFLEVANETYDCSDTEYDDEYEYIIPSHQRPTQSQLDAANNNSGSSTTTCTGLDYEILDDDSEFDLDTCGSDIIVEFIDSSGVVSDNPGNIDDMRANYYEFTFIGTYTLTLPVKTLVHVIVFKPTSATTIKVGTTLGDDDLVFSTSLTTTPENSPFTVNTYFETGIDLYFASTTTITVRVYVR